MSTQTQRLKKDIDASPDQPEVWRCEQSWFPVPATWARLGKHEQVLEDRERFYAQAACYQLLVESQAGATGGFTEKNLLHVLYRKPGSEEAVERTYRASVLETTADETLVPSDRVESDRPTGWGRIPYPVLKHDENVGVLPRVVRHGRPLNFPASVAVHESERRVRGGE